MTKGPGTHIRKVNSMNDKMTETLEPSTTAAFKDFSLVICFQLNSSLQRLLIMKTKKLIS